MDTVLHCALGHHKTRQTDVGGMEVLLRKAAQAGVSQVVFISIVRVDRNPFFCCRTKLDTENVVERSPVDHHEANQFHDLMLRIVGPLGRVPFATPISNRFLFQPIDAGEVADRLV